MMSKSLIEPSAASLWCDEMRRVPPVGAPSSAITADCIPECEMESQQQPDSLEDTADETDDERQLDRRFPSSSGRVTGTFLCANTGNNGYSGDRYSGNNGYSGQKTPDNAILFTVSGITAIADKKMEIFIRMTFFHCSSLQCSHCSEEVVIFATKLIDK